MRYACMGGMCAIRETCPHYHATHRPVVVERLCDKGHDGEMTERAVVIRRPTNDWQPVGIGDAPLFAQVEAA